MSRVFIDMDGTIADFYGTPGWKSTFRNRCAWTPEIMSAFFTGLHPLISNFELRKYTERYSEVIICSMTPWDTPREIQDAVANAKVRWMEKHFPDFTNIIILPYKDNKNDLNGAIYNNYEGYLEITWKDHLIDDNPKFLLSFNGSAEMPPWIEDFYWMNDL